MGLDDVRPFNFRQRDGIPIYASPDTMRGRSAAASSTSSGRRLQGVQRAALEMPRCSTARRSTCSAWSSCPCRCCTARTRIYGFRFGNARVPDRPQRDSGGFAGTAARPGRAVSGRAARQAAPHPLHGGPRRCATVEQAGAAARLLHAHLPRPAARSGRRARLPPHVRLAYDGLEIRVEDGTRWPRIYRSLEEIGPELRPHRPHHRQLRRRARRATGASCGACVALARERGWKPSVLTFDPHPTRVVAPERAPRLMTTPEQRCR